MKINQKKEHILYIEYIILHLEDLGPDRIFMIYIVLM